MQKYILLVTLGSAAWTVTSNVKVDAENNLYNDLSQDLRQSLVFKDDGQAFKNAKATLAYNKDYKVHKIAVI